MIEIYVTLVHFTIFNYFVNPVLIRFLKFPEPCKHIVIHFKCENVSIKHLYHYY